MSWQQRIEQVLHQRQQQGLLRRRSAVTLSPQARLTHGDQLFTHFSSNDYLGLSQHPAVIEAWCSGARKWGTGAGASGHVTGYSPSHEQLEQTLAQWLDFPRALLFSSGFAANQALVFALAESSDTLIADKLMHASLQEAAALSPARYRRFPHNSLTGLVRQLAATESENRLVITEGVFSMDGDQAPLAAISEHCRAHQAWLMVDDAHGIGVIGEEGRGSCAQQQVKPDILVVTFGKALGVSGAAVLCSAEVAEYLEQQARHLIYSTALPAAQADAVLASIAIVRQQPEYRQRLSGNITLFRQQCLHHGIALTDSQTAIQPVIIGDNHQALAVADKLKSAGHWIQAIRPPTVPPGSARLRITLSAAHSERQIAELVEALRHAL
ncbi:8-amino-7-oxononanoate synthase [Tatumella sp. TA1]|uniref:8-amino-7-oxononanoate synthase n=1 Tax=Rosenbergiella collisarenosi TaxID=1544695 RepID=UPI0008F94484|nr:8-amino-7-oxononanoate synthase [Rosenbergiella collisarenosi]MBT0722129.1 8-amino-7-oxononanoate synthase [Rosenbergiella collisarenosi]QGX90996.1 8-amino-7-oxononanoate synthase [Tatumella sp. TA1]